MIADWDDAYANAAHIPGGADYPARWAAAAEAFRARHAPATLAYGADPRARIDLFRPEGASRGLLAHVHGGYWRAFDRGLWSHLAAGPLARGWTVAIPGYVLAPRARVAAITRAIAAAVEIVAGTAPGPIRLSGHSAGGHLATRQICEDSALAPATLARIERVVSISGLHDLRPLLRTAMNADLGLDMAEATAESPALRRPLEGARVHVWVGDDERPEFVRQSTLLANVWTGPGADMSQTAEPGRHHFDVIEGLADPDSGLIEALLGD